MMSKIATPAISGIADTIFDAPPDASAPKMATPMAPPVYTGEYPVCHSWNCHAHICGISKNGKNNCQYGVADPAKKSPPKPKAKMKRPPIIDKPIPNRFITFALSRLLNTNPTV